MSSSEKNLSTTRSAAESRRFWGRLFIQPALLLIGGALLIAGLGLAQRLGFISADGGHHPPTATAEDTEVQYICPMMCTPPLSQPGRCPVCGMELVPATTQKQGDTLSVQIEPAARRLANIQTAEVTMDPVHRVIRAVGELNYDEGKLKTISAYVDGRLERLYADYTGVVVQQGDQLALVYSPRLYSGQVELMMAKRARQQGTPRDSQAATSDYDLYDAAKQRLLELGMTDVQIEQLVKSGDATSRMHLVAPISGTVIEKLAVEGEYVKEGQAIYRLADLSTVWLMLQLFPEDAAFIRYGQKVQAEVQSLPGEMYAGRVAFIDPTVDPKTRTVGVRVVIKNDHGRLRVGDYATAAIEIPLSDDTDRDTKIYDPELASKWISPRHPHIIRSAPGKCPECGIDLMPASAFGFSDQPSANSSALTVPRNAVLMAGNHSVVYVEVEPGRFELRHVVLGPNTGDRVIIRQGVQAGERVATRGNFLIDSQMQLAGNPSLIDPNKFEPRQRDAVSTSDATAEAKSSKIEASLSTLSPDDRRLAEQQQICPVTGVVLGSMGPPSKVDVNGTAVLICCESCRRPLIANPDKYLAKLPTSRAESPRDSTANDDREGQR